MWITFVFAIVPRETFRCWFFVALLLCRSVCRSAGRSVVLLVSACLMVFCFSAGFSAALLVVLLAFCLCCLRLGLPGAAGGLSLCLPVLGVFLSVVTLPPVGDLCRLHLPCWLVFSVAQLSVSVVHVDILLFVVVHLFIHCLISLSIHTHFFPILIGFGNVPVFVALCSFVRDICAIISVSCVVRHCAGSAAVGCVVACRAAAVFLLSDFRLIGFSLLLVVASSYRLMMLSIFFASCLYRFLCLLVLGILRFLSFRKVSFFRLLLFS